MKPKTLKLVILVILIISTSIGLVFVTKHVTKKPVQNIGKENSTIITNLTSEQLNHIGSNTSAETKNLLANIATQVKLSSGCLENDALRDTAINREINYQKPGQQFGLKIANNCSIIDPNADLGKLANWLDILQKHNLKPTTEIDIAKSQALSQNRHDFTFTSSDFVCGLTFLRHENSSHCSALSCIDVLQIEQIYHTLKPVMESYFNSAAAKTITSTPFLNTDSLQVKDLADGYTRLMASFNFEDGKRLPKLFYRTPDQKWHFLNTTGQNCSDFDTSELKRVFAGVNCKNQNGEYSTVQP